MFEKKIGIDLGTSTTLIYMKGRGIVLQEPSVVAITSNDKIVEAGYKAQSMLGRVPESIEVIHPLRDGVIANYRLTEYMLIEFISRLVRNVRLFSPDVMISTPVGITSVERRAVEDAARKAARKQAYTIPEPLAAAIGAGLPVNTPTGNMVIDIGGGTSEAAVISMNGIVTWKSVRVAGMKLNDAITSYVRRNNNLIIGEQTAEEIKITIGSATQLEKLLVMEVKGRDQVTGLPKTIKITSDEITEALNERLLEISSVAKGVLEITPPELASDIIDRGVIITGGSAQLRNIDMLLTQQTGVPCYVADNPTACVALGAGRGLDMRKALDRASTADLI
ncbi:rod shape-determining protein [Anaerolineales bacterium HSG6]|nr:rod shape-determining protein [Anaerolineales bacterium HSG6]MDM8530319.1 rod shape-determining protein [Anaerolineales bacterium HSG25]